MVALTSRQQEPESSLESLDRLAIVYLTLPLLIFLIGWYQWWAAILLIVCVGYALRQLAEVRGSGALRLSLTPLQMTVAVVAGCGWTVLGGADHFFFANADWHIRDAVLHDLVASPWPVGYGLLDAKESLLRAPIAFYLPAALVGKALSLSAAHVAMGFWTAAGASLFLLQVLSLTPSRLSVALTVTAIVVLFSGLDIVGNLLNDGPRFRADWNITTHLEWWAGKFQYSSMTTQLFWVPNHALGGWLSIGLLYRHKRSAQLNAMLPMIVVALALWSPLTAVGFVPFVLLRTAIELTKRRPVLLFNPRVWVPATIVGVMVAAYLLMDSATIPKGLSVGGAHANLVDDLLQQAQFFLLEAGLIGALIFWMQRSIEIALALIILAVLPLVYLGPGNDLVMRASIPSLAVLMIGACLSMVDRSSSSSTLRQKSWLAGFLLVGAVTPIEECARGLLLPSWPINMVATLNGANCGHDAPHYIARIDEQVFAPLFRPVNRLELGPQGPQECDNPAFDLMWTWPSAPAGTKYPRPIRNTKVASVDS